jgi:hypothetical protein
MSLCHCSGRRGAAVALLLALVLMAAPALLIAQEEKTPKFDLFLGYQWLHPGVTVANAPNQVNPTPFKLPDIPQGVGVSGAYNFTRYLALEGDYGGNWNKFANDQTATIGPRLMWRGDNVDFFVHALGGVSRLSPKELGTSSNGAAAILGGGMDLKIWKHLSWRVFEADFVGSHYNFADRVAPTDSHLQRPSQEGVRLRSGLVFNFGGGKEAPVAAACSVQPSEVMVGEPVHVTVAPSNFNPKHTLTYNWTSTGGKIEGKDTAANIDTNGMTGGSYTATARVTDPKAKKNNEASCTSNFTVKEPPKNPPQMSCSANPASVQAGTASAITCTCTSPDNVPVTIGNWTATSGSISGSGNTATLNTNGASPGQITVNATCTDSRGLTASNTAAVTVENPPPPPPQCSKLNECQYPNKVKPWRVDNTCKAALDDVALRLQQEPDSKVVVVGNADPKEKRKNLAGERAVDVKAYLSGGEAKQNIDASRIETRTGSAGTMTSEHWIVPAGANCADIQSATPVDETKVKPIPDHPKPAAKKATKKAQ